MSNQKGASAADEYYSSSYEYSSSSEYSAEEESYSEEETAFVGYSSSYEYSSEESGYSEEESSPEHQKTEPAVLTRIPLDLSRARPPPETNRKPLFSPFRLGGVLRRKKD